MERKTFDMNQCKNGDFLVTRGGAKIMYIGKNKFAGIEEQLFAHRVAYLDEDGYITAIGARTDVGGYFISCTGSRDVVGFW